MLCSIFFDADDYRNEGKCGRNRHDLPDRLSQCEDSLCLTKYNGKKVDVMKALGITAPTLDKWLKDESIDYKLFKKKKYYSLLYGLADSNKNKS